MGTAWAAASASEPKPEVLPLYHRKPIGASVLSVEPERLLKGTGLCIVPNRLNEMGERLTETACSCCFGHTFVVGPVEGVLVNRVVNESRSRIIAIVMKGQRLALELPIDPLVDVVLTPGGDRLAVCV